MATVQITAVKDTVDGSPINLVADEDGKLIVSGGGGGGGGAVTIADGASTTLGTTTDAASAGDTTNTTIVAFFKRLQQRFTTLLSILPASLGIKTPANSFPVTLPTVPGTADGTGVQLYGLNGTTPVALTTEVSRDTTYILRITGLVWKRQVALTAADSDITNFPVTGGLYIGTGGTVIILNNNGETVTYSNVPSGTFLPVEVKQFKAASTALNVVAGWY